MNDIPPVTTSCGGPSLHQLRRLETGELPELEGQRVRAHVSGCSHCQSVLREFESDGAAFRASVPFSALAARWEQRPVRWARFARQLAVGLGLPAAAAATFFLAPSTRLPTHRHDLMPAANGIRTKGGLSTSTALDFFVQVPDGAREGTDGEALKEGDRIRLRYSTGQKPYVLIVGVDADGTVFPYLAADERSTRSRPGKVLAPNSITLDDDPRPERVFAIFSDEPIELGEVRPAAKSAVKAVGGHVERVTELPLAGTVQRSLLLNKVAR